VSIRDPEFFHRIHNDSTEKRTNIPARFAKAMGLKGSMVFEPVLEVHKGRRKAVDPFFSRHNIERLEPMIVEQAQILEDRLRSMKDTATTARLEHAFFAFASDVVGRICCETPTTFLQDKDFFPQW
jgi:cytochrome P450